MSVSWWKLDRGHKFKLVALMRCREIQLELRRRMKISCGFGQMPEPEIPICKHARAEYAKLQ